jgi:hypothetical protein
MPRGAALGKSRQKKARRVLATKNNSLYKSFPDAPGPRDGKTSSLISFMIFAAQ